MQQSHEDKFWRYLLLYEQKHTEEIQYLFSEQKEKIQESENFKKSSKGRMVRVPGVKAVVTEKRGSSQAKQCRWKAIHRN